MLTNSLEVDFSSWYQTATKRTILLETTQPSERPTQHTANTLMDCLREPDIRQFGQKIIFGMTLSVIDFRHADFTEFVIGSIFMVVAL